MSKGKTWKGIVHMTPHGFNRGDLDVIFGAPGEDIVPNYSVVENINRRLISLLITVIENHIETKRQEESHEGSKRGSIQSA